MMAKAWATTSVGSCSTRSHSPASQPDAPQTITAMSAAMPATIHSMLRSKSRMDCAVWAPPVKRAISRPRAGVMPMSSRLSQACNTA